MTHGLDALTEKEKQTLRLLAGGHDAKSMARHLGLSVHTVNERLRDCRRKLGASSSREAARQLREAEAQSPELLGDKGLGDAAAAMGVEQVRASTRAIPGNGRIAWITGGLIMSFALAIYALAALSGGGASRAVEPSPAVASEPAEQAAVLEAARKWTALADAEDWTGTYNTMGAQFRAHNTQQRWAEVSQRVHGELGTLRTRDVLTIDFAPAPLDGYWVIKYRANYTKRTGVVETVALDFEDGAWKVVGVVVD